MGGGAAVVVAMEGGGGGGWRLASGTPTIRSDHTDVRSKREDPPSSPRCKLIRGGGRIITCDAQHAVLPERLRVKRRSSRRSISSSSSGSSSISRGGGGGDVAAGNV